MNEDLRNKIQKEIDHQIEDLGMVDGGSKEEQMICENICKLTDTLNRLDSTELDAFDKQERREAEKVKNRAAHALEVEKSKLKWDRVLFEGGKIVVPGILSWVFYNRALKTILKYEETGRITSDGGRMASRLPNPFGFMKK
jgi:hypothetical protein